MSIVVEALEAVVSLNEYISILDIEEKEIDRVKLSFLLGSILRIVLVI